MNKKRTEKRQRRSLPVQAGTPAPQRPDPNRYPKGWDRKRVQALADYYDHQTDEEAIAEMEAAFEAEESAMIQVPLDLVPAVQRLLARRVG